MHKSEIVIRGPDSKTAVTCQVLPDYISYICTSLWAKPPNGRGVDGKVGCLSRPIQSRIAPIQPTNRRGTSTTVGILSGAFGDRAKNGNQIVQATALLDQGRGTNWKYVVRLANLVHLADIGVRR